MPRAPRLIAPGTYHVTSRGTAGEPIFRNDGDRLRFLKLLDLVVERHRWTCFAYCLMTTHYHVVFRTENPDLDRGMHTLNACHAQSFNRRYGRFGHLFAERFHSVLVARDEHMQELVRYVALNPVRAGVCTSPAEWEWSSYGAAVGLRAPRPCLGVDSLLRLFGLRPGAARRNLRAFVEDA